MRRTEQREAARSRRCVPHRAVRKRRAAGEGEEIDGAMRWSVVRVTSTRLALSAPQAASAQVAAERLVYCVTDSLAQFFTFSSSFLPKKKPVLELAERRHCRPPRIPRRPHVRTLRRRRRRDLGRKAHTPGRENVPGTCRTW